MGALVLATLTALALRGLFQRAGSNALQFVNGALEACRFVGDLFIRGLKMIIVPLIVTAVVSWITGMKCIESFRRLGIKTVAFYMVSSLVAITVGLVAVNTVKPGLVDGAPNEAKITVTKWIMATAPISVYALILPVAVKYLGKTSPLEHF